MPCAKTLSRLFGRCLADKTLTTDWLRSVCVSVMMRSTDKTLTPDWLRSVCVSDDRLWPPEEGT